MGVIAEALEDRTMMAATPASVITDQAAATVALKQIQTAVKNYQKGFQADFKLISKDVKALGKSANNKVLLKTLQLDQNKGVATLDAEYAQISKGGKKALGQLTADAFKLAASPTDTTLQTKVQTELSAFENQAQAAVTQFLTDLGACVTKLQQDCNALATANADATKLAGDLQGAVLHGQTNASTIQSKTFSAQAAVGQLLTDLSPT